MGKFQVIGLAILAGVPLLCGAAYLSYRDVVWSQGSAMPAYVLGAVAFLDLVIGLVFFAKGKPTE